MGETEHLQRWEMQTILQLTWVFWQLGSYRISGHYWFTDLLDDNSLYVWKAALVNWQNGNHEIETLQGEHSMVNSVLDISNCELRIFLKIPPKFHRHVGLAPRLDTFQVNIQKGKSYTESLLNASQVQMFLSTCISMYCSQGLNWTTV